MAATQSRRLFLALWPDQSVRSQLAAHACQWTWPPTCVRYAPADWHVTLHFLGHVALGQVAAIEASAAVPFQPFELVLAQPELWHHGLAVLCPANVPAPLSALHERLGHALRQLGLPVEARPYRPHVTLARHADTATLSAASSRVVWRVASFALVVSTGDVNQRYQVIRQYR